MARLIFSTPRLASSDRWHRREPILSRRIASALGVLPCRDGQGCRIRGGRRAARRPCRAHSRVTSTCVPPSSSGSTTPFRSLTRSNLSSGATASMLISIWTSLALSRSQESARLRSKNPASPTVAFSSTRPTVSIDPPCDDSAGFAPAAAPGRCSWRARWPRALSSLAAALPLARRLVRGLGQGHSGRRPNTRDFRCFGFPGVLSSWCSSRVLGSVSGLCAGMGDARVSRRGLACGSTVRGPARAGRFLLSLGWCAAAG